MVFFTCNHCGDSAKKPAVAKHYQTKCRGAPIFVSCMDCMKDFKGNEYEEHIKCITEAEKYSAKGFVAKPEKNKGAMKQATWTEIVKEVVTKQTDLDSYSKRVFERVAEQPNIPRKKAKFFNFLNNCMRMNPNNAERIWSIMEEAIKEFQLQTKPPPPVNKPKTEEQNGVAAKENGETNDEEKPASDTNGKKKKSKKAKKTNDENDENAENVENVENGSDKPKKSKKNKKNSENVESENPPTVENGDKKPKKAKKRKASTSVSEQTESVETPTKAKKQKQSNETSFNWEDEIIKCLTKNGSLSTVKLQKKVFKVYEKTAGVTEANSKLEKRFSKGLRRCGAVVDGDMASVAATN